MTTEPIAPRWAYGIYDKIVVDNTEYVPVSSDTDSHLLRRVAAPDLCESFTHEALFDLHNAGRLRRFKNFYFSVKAKARKVSVEVRLSDLSKVQQAKVLWRKEYCDRFLRMEVNAEANRSDESMLQAIRTIAPAVNAMEINSQSGSTRCGSQAMVRQAPSPTALRKWLRKYQAWHYDPIVLRDNYGLSGNRKQRLQDEVYAILTSVAKQYADPLKPSKASIYEALLTEFRLVNQQRQAQGLAQFAIPSMQSLRREIAKLDDFRVMAAREGEEKAKKHFYLVRGGLGVSRPLERVEMDDWNVSLKTLLEKAGVWSRLPKEARREAEQRRVWVSAAIDCATRCIVGLYFIDGSPSSEAAINTLRMVVSDKSQSAKAAGCQTPWDMGSAGIETICTDTGSSFVSYEFRAACAALQIEIMFPPAGLPQMRGRIERVFSTFHQQLVARFHGRTFENVVAKGDYNAEAMAVIDADELRTMLTRYVVDVYHNTPHEGLGGETPRNAWIRLNRQFSTEQTLDEDVARSIFGTTMDRMIRKEGVELFGLFYQDIKLQELRRNNQKKTVLVRVDQTDLGFVSVRIEGGWLTVACTRPGMDGVNLHEWVAANEKIRREFAEQAKISHDVRLQAIEDIRNFSKAATERAGLEPPTYSSDQVIKLARWGVSGRRSEEMDADGGDFLADEAVDTSIGESTVLGQVLDAAGAGAAVGSDDGVLNAHDDAVSTADDDDDMFMEI
ncbi:MULTISPECIES: integrase [unclassified Mesorhizobium]|uniref:integrase n=1 Tax=unclassified Mesorhizobium TaxID=325217 RepID=UPI003015035E